MTEKTISFPSNPKDYVLQTLEHISKNLDIQVDIKKIEIELSKVEKSIHAHKFKWKKQGISFERGVFLYVLGPVLGLSNDRPKHITLDVWVTDFYKANPQLAVAFNDAENEVFGVQE